MAKRAQLGGSNWSFNGYLSQIQLPTVATQTYLLSFWLENTTNPYGSHQVTPNTFSANWGTNELFSASNLGIFGWTNLQFVVTARGNGNDQLRFVFTDRYWNLSLDDVSITPFTPPSLQSITPSNDIVRLRLMVPAGVQLGSSAC
jgi:hypothetical protein